MLKRIVGQVGLASGAVAAIVFTAQHVKPVYAGRAPVVQELLSRDVRRDSIQARAPWIHLPRELAVRVPQFEADRRAFTEDLLRTGRIRPARAESLATYAVREAYRRKLPPALVFGVMMTENEDLRSSAQSSVGAVGLMQIYPKAWVRSLGRYLGTNLRDDETNLRYGAFILSHFLYGADRSLTAEGSVRRGLLRYNGCVRGTNTPNCHQYPDVVRRRIDRLAVSLCGIEGYERCVAEPLRYSMDGEG